MSISRIPNGSRHANTNFPDIPWMNEGLKDLRWRPLSPTKRGRPVAADSLGKIIMYLYMYIYIYIHM